MLLKIYITEKKQLQFHLNGNKNNIIYIEFDFWWIGAFVRPQNHKWLAKAGKGLQIVVS